MNGIIQGNSAVVSFFKDAWVPFLCATDITVSLNADTIATRTPGFGHWGKNAYQKLNWTINISGLAIYNQPTDANFTALDSMDNMLSFNTLLCRVVFTDDQGDVKSVQGSVIINGTDFEATAGALLKTNITMLGDGELEFFNGYIPCPSVISTITITGQTASDGIVHIAYTYTGSPMQVQWRIDGTGPYLTALIGVTIDVPGLPPGSHSVEIIPLCANGYLADTSTSAAFVVTQAMTCSAVCTNISTSGGAITPTFSGTPSQWKYRFDGGSWNYLPIIVTSVSTAGLSIGAHTVDVVPVCANGVEGTGASASFTISVSPTQSLIQYNLFSLTAGDNILQIFVNGILNGTATGSGTHSGSFTAPIGATVTGRLNVNNPSGQNGTLTTVDNTTSTTLDTRSHGVPGVLIFSVIANGDTFTFGGSVL